MRAGISAYTNTLNFLYSQLPMFQRVGSAAFKKGLGNTLNLLEVTGNPQLYYPCIHVAGTNGKGTVAHMLAACLTAAGFRTGLYVSPHYRDFRERIKIDGKMISRQDVVGFVRQIRADLDRIKPSFFEMTVVMALDTFARYDIDIAVIETGLGGRLDSTNVISPLVSVITNISYDHMSMLGNTLPKIAREKAGIIKKDVPVVIGEYQHKVAQVFTSTAARRNAALSFADRKLKSVLLRDSLESQEYRVMDRGGNIHFDKLKVGCSGPFQAANLITALHTLRVLGNAHPRFLLRDHQIKKGMLHIRKLSGYMGRWQTLGKKPLILADSAHNAAGLSITLKKIKGVGFPELHFVLGFVNDKDLDAILTLFPKDAKYYFCKPDIPRGLDTFELKVIAEIYGLVGEEYTSVRNAMKAAKRAAAKEDLIFAGGSTFVVAEVI
jgi:dihydrofolate synthase/folylpolyglutamate synthase